MLLRKLGCEEDTGRTHITYYVYNEEGRQIAATGVSHEPKGRTIPDSLVSLMAKELCIQTQVLRRLYECPYGWEDYLEHYNPDLNPRRQLS